MRPHVAAQAATGRSGVAAIGVAQEYASVFTGTQKEASNGIPWFAFTKAQRRVTCYYFYLWDVDVGPAFIKICAYFPYPAKVWLNGHEWAKRQAAQAGIGFVELSNGFAATEDPAALQDICDRLGSGAIRVFVERWLTILPTPLTDADRDAGYWWELSMRQVEVSRTIVFTHPRHARGFFEALVADNLDIGRPDQVELIFCDCSGPGPRVVIGWPWSGCEGSVRDCAVLRAAGGAGGGPGTDDRPAAGPNRRAGGGDRGAEAAAGRLLAQLLQAAVERRTGQAGAEVAARPVGAQARRAAGAGGRTLRQIERPDEVVVHEPGACSGCGGWLTGEDRPVGVIRRQVFDIPPITVRVVEHRLISRCCSCGAVTQAPAPAGVTAPVAYGPQAAAIAVYLCLGQHLPVARTAGLLAELFGTPMATGTGGRRRGWHRDVGGASR